MAKASGRKQKASTGSAGAAYGKGTEPEVDRLRQAREEFVQRLGEGIAAVHDGKLAEDAPEAEREAQLERLRQRIERRKAAREELVARLDADIRRDEELIADLERQGRPEDGKGGDRGGGKDSGKAAGKGAGKGTSKGTGKGGTARSRKQGSAAKGG